MLGLLYLLLSSFRSCSRSLNYTGQFKDPKVCRSFLSTFKANGHCICVNTWPDFLPCPEIYVRKMCSNEIISICVCLPMVWQFRLGDHWNKDWGFDECNLQHRVSPCTTVQIDPLTQKRVTIIREVPKVYIWKQIGFKLQLQKTCLKFAYRNWLGLHVILQSVGLENASFAKD